MFLPSCNLDCILLIFFEKNDKNIFLKNFIENLKLFYNKFETISEEYYQSKKILKFINENKVKEEEEKIEELIKLIEENMLNCELFI